MTLSAPYLSVLLAGILTLAGCLLGLSLKLRRLKKELQRCSAELALGLPAATASETVAEAAPTATVDFSQSLQQASLKQRLQNGADWRSPPEKYRYAAALADQGMDAEGIAAVLDFPIEAAQQLIALKRAARGRQDLPAQNPVSK